MNIVEQTASRLGITEREVFDRAAEGTIEDPREAWTKWRSYSHLESWVEGFCRTVGSAERASPTLWDADQ